MADDDAVGPTGRRRLIRSPDGRTVAEIAEVGAALRRLSVDGVEHVPTYPDDAPTPAASGVVLVPWPNRVRGGQWAQRGVSRQLAISEPKLGNASHGLLRYVAYRARDEQPDALTLAADVFPQTGWPFHLRTQVRFRAVTDGLDIVHTLVNVGAEEAPVALGVHPYLQIGGVETADLTITLPAATRFETDAQQIPVAQVPVDPAHDLRRPRRLGGLSLDTAFGDLVRDPDGAARAVLTAPDGRTVTVELGPEFAYAQVFTTDRYPGHPLAVAIEPMTAPADALNSGRSLRWLAPQESWQPSWRIRVGVSGSGSARTLKK